MTGLWCEKRRSQRSGDGSRVRRSPPHPHRRPRVHPPRPRLSRTVVKGRLSLPYTTIFHRGRINYPHQHLVLPLQARRHCIRRPQSLQSMIWHHQVPLLYQSTPASILMPSRRSLERLTRIPKSCRFLPQSGFRSLPYRHPLSVRNQHLCLHQRRSACDPSNPHKIVLSVQWQGRALLLRIWRPHSRVPCLSRTCVGRQNFRTL